MLRSRKLLFLFAIFSHLWVRCRALHIACSTQTRVSSNDDYPEMVAAIAKSAPHASAISVGL
jgi:hypothetical protein